MIKVRGMSGGGIWRIDVDHATGQIQSPLLVGIGIEYHEKMQAFVATRTRYAVAMARSTLS
jgi:hypothetical protein